MRFFFLVLSFVALCLRPADAGIVYVFANGGQFDGDGATDTADLGTDSVTGEAAIVTSIAVNDGGGAAVLNENGGALGVGNAVFDVGESWEFSWGIDTILHSFDLNALSGVETFQIQSSDWVGASFTSSETEVTFDSVSGTFTFADGISNDVFDLDSIVTGDLAVSASSSYVFSMGSGSAALGAFSFSAVPEPSSMSLLCVWATAFAFRRRRRTA